MDRGRDRDRDRDRERDRDRDRRSVKQYFSSVTYLLVHWLYLYGSSEGREDLHASLAP